MAIYILILDRRIFYWCINPLVSDFARQLKNRQEVTDTRSKAHHDICEV